MGRAAGNRPACCSRGSGTPGARPRTTTCRSTACSRCALHMQGIWAATVAVALLAGQRAAAGRAAWPWWAARTARRSSPRRLRRRPRRAARTPARRPRRRAARTTGATAAPTARGCSSAPSRPPSSNRGFARSAPTWILDDPRVGGIPANVRAAENLGWITAARAGVRAPATGRVGGAPGGRRRAGAAPVGEPRTWLDHEQVTGAGAARELGNGTRRAGRDARRARRAVPDPGASGGRRRLAPGASPGSPEVAGRPRRPRDGVGRSRIGGLELPLAGVRVLDLGTIIAGPYVGTLLGELGRRGGEDRAAAGRR